MIAVSQGALLALTALSLGLRTTSVLVPRIHPLARLVVSAVVGSIFVFTVMQIAMSHHLHDLGLGVLLSLSPVGIFDGFKWYFRWKGR
jgi:hypothetical protein